MSLLSNILGGDSEGASDNSATSTAVPPEIIARAEKSMGDELADSPHDLETLLDAVQNFVWSKEYASRRGNAFFEQIVQDFNDSESLRRPVLFRDGELFCVILAEGWADIGEQVTIDGKQGLSANELRAVTNAHQLYADDVGLSEYSAALNIMAINVRNEGRLRSLVDLVDIDDDQVQLSNDEAE